MSETTKEERDAIRYVKPRYFMPERVMERLCNDADNADTARQEAAKMREAAVYAKDSIIAEYTGACDHGSAYEDAVPVINDALYSSDASASEPAENMHPNQAYPFFQPADRPEPDTNLSASINSGDSDTHDSAPADPPECSCNPGWPENCPVHGDGKLEDVVETETDVAREAQGALFRLKCRAQRAEDGLYYGDLGASEEDASIIRPYLSQPAPAVPEKCICQRHDYFGPFPCPRCGGKGVTAPAGRPESPLREGAMRAAAGYDSPHPDEDRPDPSCLGCLGKSVTHTCADRPQTDAQREALKVCKRLSSTVIAEDEDTGEMIHIGDIAGADLDYLHQYLLQPVPNTVRRLPGTWLEKADHCTRAATDPNVCPRDSDAKAYSLRSAIYHGVAEELECALTMHDGYSPTVPNSKYTQFLEPFVRQMDAELHANAGKGDRKGWLSMSSDQSMLEIYYHVAKLQKAVRDGDGALIREHSADVANMSMMLLDICVGLDGLEKEDLATHPTDGDSPVVPDETGGEE